MNNADMGPPPEWDRLLSAAQKNNAELIRTLVQENGVDPSHANRVGQSALHVAALWGHDECVEALIELGGNVNAANQITGATVLHMAAQSSKGSVEGKVKCAEKLLAAGADPSTPDHYGSRPIDYAQDERLSSILVAIAPPIFHLVETCNIDKVKALIESDANVVNVRHCDQMPLLVMLAKILSDHEGEDESAQQQQLDLLTILLQHGADPNVSLSSGKGQMVVQEDSHDAPLLQVCLALRQVEPGSERAEFLSTVAKLLMAHQAEIVPEVEQLLHDAARRNRLDMAKFLLVDLGVSPNVQGRQGMTPLQFAARSGRVEMVQYLLEQPNIDVTIADERGQTALDAARVNGKDEIVAILESHGGQE